MVKYITSYFCLLKKYGWMRFIHLIIIIQVFLGVLYVRPDLSKSVEPPHSIEHIGDYVIPLGGFNPVTVGMTWLIMVFLVLLSLKVTKKLSLKPGRLQVVFEKLVGFFAMLCEDTLGKERGRKFVPLIGTVFMLVWISNLAGLIPLPYFEEPTANVNFTLSLGLICFIISHFLAIKVKGLGNWLKTYMFSMPFYIGMPVATFIVLFFVLKGVFPESNAHMYASLAAALALAYFLKLFVSKSLRFYVPNPLDIIGEMGKVVSHSMRLFGNIFGGVIIMVVISNLTRYVMFPTLLSAFFGIFVGTVQAFVFSMLALVYIAVLIAEE